jgi:DNA-binding transcriptional regulator YdaS (Cro superfamily)
MDLKTYLADLDRPAREALAGKCDTSLGHLNNVSYGYKPCGPLLAVLIETHTDGAVTRRDLRPDDWQAIWPELATA